MHHIAAELTSSPDVLGEPFGTALQPVHPDALGRVTKDVPPRGHVADIERNILGAPGGDRRLSHDPNGLGVLLLRQTHRDVAVADTTRALPRRLARPANPDRQLALGLRRHTDIGVGEELAFMAHIGVSERPPNGLERLVEPLPSGAEVDTEGIELRLHVPGTDPQDRPPTREMIEGAERLRRLQRMAVRRDPHDGQQMGVLRMSSQVREGRDRVVPRRGHLRRIVVVGNGDVIAHADEVVAVLVGGLGDRDEIVDGRRVLPLVDEGAGQGLDRELDSERPLPRLRQRTHIDLLGGLFDMART